MRWFAKAAQIAARHREEAQRQGRIPAGKPAAAMAQKDGKKGQLYVYEVIGEDWWTGGGVTAKKVADALGGELKNVDSLDVFINSEGGDLFEAKAIYTQLKRFEPEVTVHIDGIAASAATLVAMAGDKIITASHATWMVHNPWTIALGDVNELRATADVLELEGRALAETYAARTGGDVEEMVRLMNAETWMNAEQAKEQGFTDEIANVGEGAAADQKAAASSSRLVIAAAQTHERLLSPARILEARAAMRRRDRSGLPERQRASGLPRRASNQKS